MKGLVDQLLQIAEAEFRLDLFDRGDTRRNLNTALEEAGEIGPEWRPDPVPDELQHVWLWYYNELRSSQALTYEELNAWARLTQRRLDRYEVEILRALDRKFHYVQAHPDEVPMTDATPPAPGETMKAALRNMATKKLTKGKFLG